MSDIRGVVTGEIETLFKVIEPLEELKNGFGYKGVLLRNKSTDKLQCHICGQWFKGLSTHIVSKHKMKTLQYKKEFQLPLTFPLVSVSTSAKHSERASKEKNLKMLAKNRNPTKASRSKKRWVYKYMRKNASFVNKFGVCEEQINRRFLIVADMVGREPTQKDLIKLDHSLWAAIRRRFKNINEYRKKQNFSITKRANILTDEQLISCLREKGFRYGKVTSGMFIIGSPNKQTFINRFGSFSRALSLAGFGG